MNKGIVRKIDDLGRVVIPKEIRNVLNINSFDDLNIYYNDKQIIIEKFSYFNNSIDDEYISAFKEVIEGNVYITDREKILTEGFLHLNNLSTLFLEKIISSSIYESVEKECLQIGNKQIDGYFYLYPITKNSGTIGSIIVVSDKKISLENKVVIKLLSRILAIKSGS